MTISSIERLRHAFVKALGVSPEADFECMTYSDTPGWDSVAHIALIVEIETAFNIMLPTDDVIEMNSFRKAEEIVARNGVNFSDAAG
jgi:acyl carrier protein